MSGFPRLTYRGWLQMNFGPCRMARKQMGYTLTVDSMVMVVLNSLETGQPALAP